MKDKAQRRKDTRRVIRKRLEFIKRWDLYQKAQEQSNRLSKVDFDFGTKKDYPDSTKPTISDQKKIDKMNYLDE